MSANEAYEKFINKGADESDPFWALFNIAPAVNTAIQEAVKYGFKEGYRAANKEDLKVQYVRVRATLSNTYRQVEEAGECLVSGRCSFYIRKYVWRKSKEDWAQRGASVLKLITLSDYVFSEGALVKSLGNFESFLDSSLDSTEAVVCL